MNILHPVLGGVSWAEKTGNSPTRSDLWYLANNSSHPISLRGYRGIGVPVELGGRMYWMAPQSVMSYEDHVSTYLLCSAPTALTPVKTEARILLHGILSTENSNSAILAHGDSVYFASTGIARLAAGDLPPAAGGDKVDSSTLWLYRLRLHPDVSLTKLTPVPAGSYYLDGDTLYIDSLESKSTWQSWAHPDQARDRISVIYRYRLPD